MSCYPTEEDNEPKDIKWPSGNQRTRLKKLGAGETEDNKPMMASCEEDLECTV